MKSEFVFCEACGEPVKIPKRRSVHILCGACRVLPRANPLNTKTIPATFRELLGLREEPRSRMVGDEWK